MEKNKDQEFFLIQMETNIQVNGKMIKNKGREFIILQMAINM
jgi:hypothetical protein